MTVWQPGVRCLLVSGAFSLSRFFVDCPTPGVVYTVREVEPHDGYLFLRFEEILNPAIWCNGRMVEPAFVSHRFRPLRDADLDQFRAHLTAEVWKTPADVVAA